MINLTKKEKEIIENYWYKRTNKEIIDTGTSVTYYINGKIHRDGEPAKIIYREIHGFDEEWYQNNKLHREDGPARKYENIEELQVLMLFYVGKLFFNYCILLYSKGNIEKMDSCLICSYVFQSVLFGLLVYLLTKINNDYKSIILLFNNILFSSLDLSFRVKKECKMRNTVNVLG